MFCYLSNSLDGSVGLNDFELSSLEGFFGIPEDSLQFSS